MKNLAFIVSGGRSGTAFCGRRLSEMIDQAHSVHEPDVWTGLDASTWSKIRTFGFQHMVIGRLTGATGLRNLSIGYLSGRLSRSELAELVRQQREHYYLTRGAPLVIEASYQGFGTLPGFRLAFPRHRIAAVVRDPRTWVTSWLNMGNHGRRGPRDLVRRWGGNRISPAVIGESSTYRDAWSQMSTFERLCWDWKTIYEAILQEVEENRRARLFRFEDLFRTEHRDREFRDFLSFLTHFDDATYTFHFDPTLLKRPVNRRSKALADEWPRWSHSRARRLVEIVDPLMTKLGYGIEAEWKALLGD